MLFILPVKESGVQDLWRELTNIDNLFGHLNYIFIILSISMTKMRWLRIYALGSGITAMLYFALRTNDLVSLTWEFIFTSVNAVQLALLVRAGMRGGLSEVEEKLLATAFPGLDRGQGRRLFALAKWQTAEPGTVLMTENQVMPQLIFITAGAASVEKGDAIVSVCGAGDFLGEMSFLTGAEASATVRVANNTEFCAFDHRALKALLDSDGEIKTAVEGGLTRNLATKLHRMNAAAARL